jgi:hypothetical protein
MANDQSIHSFVMRFVHVPQEQSEQDTEPPAFGWHGSVRHVQSDAELRFTRWEDAVAFIARYVEIETPHGSS